MIPASHFFVTGGTLRHDARSYVERQSDRDLMAGLTQGEFCYVLTSRQMGKSSLMVRAATRLRTAGNLVAVLDLTAIGQNLTSEQWYNGLLGRIGRQVDLEDELEDFWIEHDRLGPLQRFLEGIRQVLARKSDRLRASPGSVQPRLIIFVDEIDSVRSLPFPTDEFFAAIRECYNCRAAAPEFNAVTFCLLGVATPNNLIKDPQTTPFNVGQRIELTDFTEIEALPLAEGLGRDERTARSLLKRILYWTNGHPYLTQTLCQAVMRDAEIAGPAGVDRLCESMFLVPEAVERDDNLLFVREWLLRGEVDRSQLLGVCTRVFQGDAVADDSKDPAVAVLRLSGLVRNVDGALQIRNRIYYRVFARDWASVAPSPVRRSGSRWSSLDLARPRRRSWKLAAALVAGMALGYWAGTLRLTNPFQSVNAGNVQTRTAATQGRLAVPARSTEATPRQVDLSAFYNAGLGTNSYSREPGNDYSRLPGGLVTMNGVLFDVRGIVQLTGHENLNQPRFPEAVRSIRVGRTAEKIHFLHAAADVKTPWGARVPIAAYVFNFVDGQKWEVPVRLGKEVADSWDKASSSGWTEPIVAWQGSNGMTDRLKGSIRLFQSTWTNRFADVDIESIDLLSLRRAAAPFVVAITVD
jgi:hypothetical protein